jgi:hypothetical protein
MGILEVHFHDSQFDFSPSMNTGGDDPLEEAADGDDEAAEDGTVIEPEDGESGSGGMGAVVALGVLVALGALVGLRRRRSGDDGEDEAADRPDEEIEISA